MSKGNGNHLSLGPGRGLDRRGFIKGAIAAGVAVAGGALAACTDDDKTPQGGPAIDWDLSTDVVVVGTGFAGLAAAITAAQAGASVIVLEKAPEAEAGGNSRVCAQAVWTPTETAACIEYIKEICGDYHLHDMPDGIIEAFVNEASHNAEWLSEVAGLDMVQADSIEYPLAPSAPTAKTQAMALSTSGLGYEVVWQPVMAAAQAAGVEFMFETPLTDLLFNSDGEVVGVMAGELAIAASKGVVLCLGGFENDIAMNANYMRYPGLTWGTPYNTGDGHKICMKYDIDFWHMNSATSGTRIGLKMPGLDPLYHNVSLDLEFAANNALFWVDKYGQRFMDEKRDYLHGFGRDAIFYNDGVLMEWPRLPFWQVFDETGLPEIVGRNRCGWLEVVAGITPSEGLADEIAAGVVFKADTPEELAEAAGLDVGSFVSAFYRYQAAATSGEDDDFGRPGARMAPLQAPFYIAQVYPVMVNTNGGPRRNADAQVLRTDGSPVPRLYSAGEFGSLWAWYYQGGGNVSESFAFGRIAGRNVAELEGWMPAEA